MEDLAGKLGQLLSSDEGKAQLNSIAEMIGATGREGGGEGSGFDFSSIASMFGNAGGGSAENTEKEQSSGGFDLGGLDMGMLMKLQGLLSNKGNGSDKNTQLIKAIKPHLSERRQSKADDALKIMQLLPLLPMLKDSGLFGNLFKGNES